MSRMKGLQRAFCCTSMSCRMKHTWALSYTFHHLNFSKNEPQSNMNNHCKTTYSGRLCTWKFWILNLFYQTQATVKEHSICRLRSCLKAVPICENVQFWYLPSALSTNLGWLWYCVELVHTVNQFPADEICADCCSLVSRFRLQLWLFHSSSSYDYNLNTYCLRRTEVM